MTPTQEINVHVDGNTKVTIHIEFHEGKDSFASEVLIPGRKAGPNDSTRIRFGDDHDTANKAFQAAFHWVAKWSAARDLPILRISNPGGGSLLSMEDQLRVARQCGVEIPLTVQEWV